MTTHKYGPNSDAVEKIIERAKVMAKGEVHRIADAWRLVADDWYDAYDDAWGAWVDQDTGDALDAWDAIHGAILAEFTRDLITPAQYDLLIGPWRTVIGGDK